MKTAIYLKETDYLNYDKVGVIINVVMETDKLEVLFYQYSDRDEIYYIFQHMMELMKFGVNNTGATNVWKCPKELMIALLQKPFEGLFVSKLERA